MKKVRCNSFSAGLTAAQREELFTALGDGLSYEQAALRIRDWYRESAALDRLGFSVVTTVKAPSRTAIYHWYRGLLAERRSAAAPAPTAAVTGSEPVDYDELVRRALDEARYHASRDSLSVAEIATLDRNELARERLALDREKLALHSYHQRCAAMLARAKELLKNAPTRETSEREVDAFDNTVELILEEIERMKYGDDNLWLSPKYFIGPQAPVLFMQELNRS